MQGQRQFPQGAFHGIARDVMPEQAARQLEIMVAEQEHAALLVDQPEHDGKRAGRVRPVIHQIAQLHDVAVGLGGEGKSAGIAMHVAHHAQGHASGNHGLICA